MSGEKYGVIQKISWTTMSQRLNRSARFLLVSLVVSISSVMSISSELIEDRTFAFFGVVAITVLAPGFVISLQIAAFARWLGLPVGGGALVNPWPEGAWFDVFMVITAALFWTLVLLGLRAFFVRAYEGLT